jgi:molecular chaperone DnaJ
MTQRDYYEVLKVPKSASSGEIKKAYLAMAKKYHPDQNKDDPQAEQNFKEVSAAYDVLKDEQKKAAYDRFGHQAFSQGAGQNQHHNSHNVNVNDIFGDFFSDFMGGTKSNQPPSAKIKGSNLKYNINITLEEAFSGTNKEINFPTEVKCTNCEGKGTKEPNGLVSCTGCRGAGVVRRQQGFFTIEQTCSKCNGVGQIVQNPCANCHGYGRYSKNKNILVTIPAGVEHGTKIRIIGEGEAGVRGGSSGDLYVVVNIKPHERYKVEASNLHFQLPLNLTEAALGGEVEVVTIDGAKIMLTIPAGTETGDKIKLTGKGMPHIRSTNRGDLYAHAYIKMQKKWSKKERELLEALHQELKNNNENPGFISRMKNIWS